MGEPIIIVKDGSCTVIVQDGDTVVGSVPMPEGTFPGKDKKAKTKSIKKDGRDALEITFGDD